MAAEPIRLPDINSRGPGPAPGPLFHVVLLEPEIPNNTGNIGRTCVALGAALHLIHPLGFDLSEKARRRAGLDYWARLVVTEYRSWDDYLAATSPASRWFLTTKASRPIYDAQLAPGDHLVFGKETAGLPASLVARYTHRLASLPMVRGERSLNVATAVCAVLYEGVRQLLAADRLTLGPDGRLGGG
jgi:tRNA (cytidine/uridine-2'-O-)-methyltransferase